MANNEPKWEYKKAFHSFVYDAQDNGEPLNVHQIAKMYCPAHRKVANFYQQVLRHSKADDWIGRREKIWATEGRIQKPFTGEVADTPPEPQNEYYSDGITCPACGANLLVDDDELAKDAQTIRDLRKVINASLAASKNTGDIGSQMLNSLAQSMERLMKMQDRHQKQIAAMLAEKNAGAMTETEGNELERLTPIFIELVARSPKPLYNRIMKQISQIERKPPANDPKIVDIRPERG